MREPIARLRFSEWLAAAGAVALVVFLFALNWYDGPHPRHGWQALPALRWLLLAAAALVIVTVLAQALARGPALSVALGVVSLVVTAITVLLLIVRLATTGASLCPGAFLGLAASIAMLAGVLTSLRIEQGWSPGRDRTIEVVPLSAADGLGSQHRPT
jgi:peptidoglycan biosynthesis protein MviN/MurJ (putative lipid II flippase)